MTVFEISDGALTGDEEEDSQIVTPFGKFIIFCIVCNTAVLAADLSSHVA